VTSLIQEERIETTVAKAKEARPLAEWMITLAKQGDLAARRQAAAYLLSPAAVKFLFDELGKRYASRSGGYTRLVHAGWRKGDGADVAILEFVGNEVLQELAAKRSKKVETRRKAAEEARKQEQADLPPEDKGGDTK
jgi:large subunit ribosomal protein L17